MGKGKGSPKGGGGVRTGRVLSTLKGVTLEIAQKAMARLRPSWA